MFSKLTSSFFSLGSWTDEKTKEFEAEVLFAKDYTLWCMKSVFLSYSFEDGDSVVLKFKKVWT